MFFLIYRFAFVLPLERKKDRTSRLLYVDSLRVSNTRTSTIYGRSLHRHSRDQFEADQ
jgi:hypothetical protein